jgi:site-specific DNA-methyltransferase (adenine-specific)
MLTDVWQIPFLSTTAKERTGYPTQKPLALLERIITIFSNEGDLVLDYFCGSGTTGVAAEKLARRSILVDSNPEATSIAQARLEMLKSEATPDAGVAGA